MIRIRKGDRFESVLPLTSRRIDEEIVHLEDRLRELLAIRTTVFGKDSVEMPTFEVIIPQSQPGHTKGWAEGKRLEGLTSQARERAERLGPLHYFLNMGKISIALHPFDIFANPSDEVWKTAEDAHRKTGPRVVWSKMERANPLLLPPRKTPTQADLRELARRNPSKKKKKIRR